MRPQTGLITVPPNYPTEPTPGKIQLLLETNFKSIYHRYSPYTDYDIGFAGRFLDYGPKSPFIYTYIDEAGKGLAGLRRYESRLFPAGSAPLDVIRIGKFLATGKGTLFLGSQFLLQTFNAFNETRIYNPTSPIVAAAMGITLGTVRPQRNLDLTGGLGGLARSLIGNTIPDLFGKPTVSPPPGTVSGALPDSNLSAGKGLIRAGTAQKASALLEGKWPASQGGMGGFSTTGFLKNIAQSLFSNFIPKTQPGVTARSDEEAYGLMIGSSGDIFGYDGANGYRFRMSQMWVGGTGKGDGIRKKNQIPTGRARLFVNPDGSPYFIAGLSTNGPRIPNQTDGTTGYEVDASKVQRKAGMRYGDNVGAGVPNTGPFQASDIMVQYGLYADESNKFPTKKTDPTSVQKTKEQLDKILLSLQKGGVYEITIPEDNRVLPISTTGQNGYDRLFASTNGQPGVSPINYPLGVLAAYRTSNVRMVDNSISNDSIKKSLKLPGAGNFDAINTLRVLRGDKSIKNSPLPGWTTWEPYKDDQIAFFFYDVVNDKYIPFRSTIKGISESAQAPWEELTFIGRADRLYSYSGFTRALNFSFDVVISSIVELAPTWKRINYLMTLVKPARYTKAKLTGINNKALPYNRFMVPPMVMITIGDLYKRQPIIINTISMVVPDDASWETMNEDNTNKGDWSYLVDYIKSNKISGGGREYGQFPRMATITIGCALLEKERAIAGAANFGDAPHGEDYLESDIFNQPAMHQSLVEYQDDQTTPTTFDDKRTVQSNAPVQTPINAPTQTPTFNLLSRPTPQQISPPPVDSLSRRNRIGATISGP